MHIYDGPVPIGDPHGFIILGHLSVARSGTEVPFPSPNNLSLPSHWRLAPYPGIGWLLIEVSAGVALCSLTRGASV